ncbi:MAG: hypothetical protein PHU45_02775 [Bacilli bacterium]|nr:hypothetical protein [Bacilli bacterium]
MAVQIFIGCIDEEVRHTSIVRNGKTCSMVGFNYLDYLNGWEIWTNYACNFAKFENIGFQAMIDKIRAEDMTHRHVVLSVTELGDILDSVGSKTQEVLFCNAFLRQIGKIGDSTGEIIFRGDLQRYNDLHKRFRIHTTEVLVPVKFHQDDDTQCNANKCKRPHKIKVYLYSPYPAFEEKPLKVFDAMKIGKMYNTYQVSYDHLKIPSRKELDKLGIDEKGDNKNGN